MAAYLPNFPRGDSHSFQKIVAAFLAGESLPFADVLSAERIERIFQKHSCLFGLHGVYTTAIMVWSFLSQVLRDGKEASCQAAVARVVSYCQTVIVWTRPQRPTWMDEETYRKIPEKLVLREIRYNITEPGRRTKSIDIITTLIAWAATISEKLRRKNRSKSYRFGIRNPNSACNHLPE